MLIKDMLLRWGSFDSPDAIYQTVEKNLRRYEIALSTWSDWLEMHINPAKTKLFFMSLSPFRVGYICFKKNKKKMCYFKLLKK